MIDVVKVVTTYYIYFDRDQVSTALIGVCIGPHKLLPYLPCRTAPDAGAATSPAMYLTACGTALTMATERFHTLIVRSMTRRNEPLGEDHSGAVYYHQVPGHALNGALRFLNVL